MNDRRKIQSYLHPKIYPQDNDVCTFIEKIPLKMRGELIRQSVICGIALAEVDIRLPAIISNLYRKGITGNDIIAMINQFDKPTNKIEKLENKSFDIDSNALTNLRSMKS
ncbi:plasmid partitioning/stability family protein [Candidatus Arsenophonus triatominarum]|uniref:plasmid partitioning/stability family protein n=1 Tax=Candidatus Arsenophonus triatominarum TaxID=57911 RepID=UPI0007C565EC|nr:plasmid partitioning/stability family protein [Candidatus Arsenophonus triatominarum]